MTAPQWLTRRLADVPPGEAWLGEHERAVLGQLRLDRRREDWRLGRWTAKCALGQGLSTNPGRVEVLAAGDGAPEAWVDGSPAPVSLSLSHRAGRAVAVIADDPQVVGCDLELVEPRSDAFVREWLAPAEQRLLAASPLGRRPLLTNLIWSAKEAAAKVRREGLRADVRGAVVSFGSDSGPAGAWRPLTVTWSDGTPATTGWWWGGPRWVMVVAARPAPAVPRPVPDRARAALD